MILSWSKPFLHAGLPISTLGIALWILVLAGCCGFAGWIAVAGVTEERKNKEALKSAGLMLLFQLALAPAIAFAVLMAFGAMFQNPLLPGLHPTAFLTP